MNISLFETPRLGGPPVKLVRGWAARLPFGLVDSMISWSHYSITMYGREMPRPRLECWYNDDPTRLYKFGGGEPIKPLPLDYVVARVRRRLFEQGYGEYDSCFANRYTDGAHSIGWHADDDAWIGPVIASVSFGGSRLFKMKPKPGKRGQATDYELHHGDLLIMEAGCQEDWLHSVPKTKKRREPRINLTYRTTLRGAQ